MSGDGRRCPARDCDVRRCPAMSGDGERCPAMPGDVRLWPAMSGNGQRCPPMGSNYYFGLCKSRPTAMRKSSKSCATVVQQLCKNRPIAVQQSTLGNTNLRSKIYLARVRPWETFSYLPGLRPDAADSVDTTASRLRESVPKVIQRSSNSYLKRRPTVFQQSSKSDLIVQEFLG